MLTKGKGAPCGRADIFPNRGLSWRQFRARRILFSSQGTGQDPSQSGIAGDDRQANALTDLSSAVPYELHARITVNPGSKDAQQGEITIYRDQFRSADGVADSEFSPGGSHQRRHALCFPLAAISPGRAGLLNSVEAAVHLRELFPADAKFSTSSRTVPGVAATCFDAKL